MKRIIALLAAVCTIFACCSCASNISYEALEKDEPADADSAAWSVYIYICSDNNGRSCEAIKDMCSVSYTENVNFIVQTGGANEWDINGMNPDYIQRFVMQKGSPYLADQKPDASMGNYNTLADFLKWGTENYPAKNNVLIFMGEGNGLSALNDKRYSGDSLNIEEIYYAISLCQTAFDVIGFDGGSMASLEMATALSPYASYMIADEDPGIGWDYSNIAEYIMEYPNMSAKDFAKTVVDDCYSETLETDRSDMINMSVIDLSRMSDVLQVFDGMASQMYNQTYSLASLGALERTVATAAHCTEQSMTDLGSLANVLAPYSPDAPTLMTNALNSAVAYRAVGAYRTDTSGISVFHPDDVNEQQIIDYIDYTSCDSYKLYLKSISPNIDAPNDYVTEDYNSSEAWREYNGISISGTAYIDDNSHFCFLVEPDMNAVKNVRLNRYIYDSESDSYYSIGDESALDCMWEAQTYSDNTLPVGFFIGSEPLDVHKISESTGCILYSAQLTVNDVPSVAYIAYNLETGKYEPCGIFTDGNYTKLSFGDKVAPLYRSYDGSTVAGKAITVGFATKIKSGSLKNGTYIYEYELQDVYNRTYRSGVCFMEKTGAGETLR